MTLLKRNKRLQDMNHELEKEIKKFEQDSYFRDDSDYSSAFSDDSALDLDDDDDDDDDDENSNESESTQGHDDSNEETEERPNQRGEEQDEESQNEEQ